MVDTSEYREAMSRLGAAVNLITTDGVAGRRGFTASAVCSVTDTPPTLLVCVNRNSRTNSLLKVNGVLAVNVLAGRHRALSDSFSKGSDAALFEPVQAWTVMTTGSPVLHDAVAVFDCIVNDVREVGTHDVYFCRAAEIRVAEKVEGLVYHGRRYHDLAA